MYLVITSFTDAYTVIIKWLTWQCQQICGTLRHIIEFVCYSGINFPYILYDICNVLLVIAKHMFSSCSTICACKLKVLWTIGLINQMFNSLGSVQTGELLNNLALFILSFLTKVSIDSLYAEHAMWSRFCFLALGNKSCLAPYLCLLMVYVSTQNWRCVLMVIWHFIENKICVLVLSATYRKGWVMIQNQTWLLH